jgi:hypothetical protein
MRILITSDRLNRRPGTDLYARDLARALQRCGHFVIAYGSDPRHQLRLLEVDSLSIATDLANLPFLPDIIHSRHHLDAMTAALALPGVPIVHHVVEASSRHVPLPTHPRILCYVAASRSGADWVASQAELPATRVDVILGGVDLLRFSAIREFTAKPTNVLVYDDELEPDSPAVAAVEQAASRLGLETAFLGERFGKISDDPERHLQRFDFVCARSTKAMEALATGCAVLTIGHDCCGPLVDEGNFEVLREADFSSAAGELASASPDHVVKALSAYSAGSCLRLAQMVRAACSFDIHASRIQEVYRVAVAANAGRDEDFDAEQRATSDYLRRIAMMIKEVDQIQKSEGDVPLATASKFLDVAGKLASIQTDLDKPQW